MSGELHQAFVNSASLYALVRRPSDEFIWNPLAGTPAFEAVGTWNDARVAECSIDMTPEGDDHYADFPVLITDADVYSVQVRNGTKVLTDWIVSQGDIGWDGSAEITAVTVAVDLAAIQVDTALLITEAQRVNQVVPVPVEEETKRRIYI